MMIHHFALWEFELPSFEMQYSSFLLQKLVLWHHPELLATNLDASSLKYTACKLFTLSLMLSSYQHIFYWNPCPMSSRFWFGSWSIRSPLDENIVYGCANDPNMPNLEEIVYSDDDENIGAEADMTNLDTHIHVSPIPTTRIHKDHPVE
ncbi:hypothetical protein Tco_0836180 [Tanacetum coccineum]